MLLKTVSLAVAFAVVSPHAAAAADDLPRPSVPANLEVPAGYNPFLIARAAGTQNYICLPSTTGVTWTFLGPQATLFDEAAEQLTTHFLSPNPAENDTPRATWQHSRDTSTVWAAAIANSSDTAFVAPGAIPWLLLQAVGGQTGPAGGTRLASTTYIQRVNTSGGVAPAAGCRRSGDVGKRTLVPYTADYVFYK